MVNKRITVILMEEEDRPALSLKTTPSSIIEKEVDTIMESMGTTLTPAPTLRPQESL